MFGTRGVSQVLLQRCISRGSETCKTGGMGLTKTFKEFLFLHQSACTKKPCSRWTTPTRFYRQSYQRSCSAGFKGRTSDERKICFHVLSVTERCQYFRLWLRNPCMRSTDGAQKLNKEITNKLASIGQLIITFFCHKGETHLNGIERL